MLFELSLIKKNWHIFCPVSAQIIQFQQLCMVLAGGEGITSEVILKTLPKVAVLVRGNWVVKSEVLYPANTFSATSGVPAELMCRARDYVVCILSNVIVKSSLILRFWN